MKIENGCLKHTQLLKLKKKGSQISSVSNSKNYSDYAKIDSFIHFFLPIFNRFATILAFDVKIERDAQDLADSLGVKIFQADIIYHLFDKFMAYRDELKQKRRDEFKSIAVFPCKLKVSCQATNCFVIFFYFLIILKKYQSKRSNVSFDLKRLSFV